MSINDESIERASGGTAYDVGAVGLVRLLVSGTGLVFLIVGILGFVPGVTIHVGDIAFAGHTSRAELLGLFQVSVLHNLVHLTYGVVGLALAARPRAGALYLVLGGLVYALLWVYGLVVEQTSQANFVPLNTADNWLHLGLAVLMVALGALCLRRLSSPRRGPSLA